MSSRSATAALAALALALTACTANGDDEPGTPTTSTPATDAATTPEPTTAEQTSTPGQETTEPPTATDPATDDSDLPDFATTSQSSDDFPSGGGDLLPSIVRIGEHPDFDRVVFDLLGSDTPGYRVELVDEAVQDGSGRVVDVAGDAILAVIISGTRYPGEDEEYTPPGTYTPDGTEIVEEVRLDGTFEGQTQGFIGLDEESPFRVFTLSDPVRLVVDIAHD